MGRGTRSAGLVRAQQIGRLVLSHMHGDHWDRVAEPGWTTGCRSSPLHTPPSGCTTEASAMYRGCRPGSTALPGRHAPGPINRLLPPVMGSMLEFVAEDEIRRVYISGDTLADRRTCRHSKAIRQHRRGDRLSRRNPSSGR